MHVLQIYHSKEHKEEDDNEEDDDYNPIYVCELLGKVKIRRKLLIIKYPREWASFLRREKIAPAPDFSKFTKRMSILLNIALSYYRQRDFGPLLDVMLENDVLIHHSLKLFKGILLFTLHDWTYCNVDGDGDQNTNNQEHVQYFQFAILKWISKGLCDVHLKKSANLFTPKEKGDFWDFLFNNTILPSTTNTLTNSSFFYKVLSCCLERCIILHNSSFILKAIESGIKAIIHDVPTEILDQILTICSDNSEITSKVLFFLSIQSPVHHTLQPGPYALEYHLKRFSQTLGTPPQSLLSLPVLLKHLPPHPISKPIAEITKILVELDSFLCSFSSMTEVEPSDPIFADFHLFFKNIHTCLIDPPEEYLTSIYSLTFFSC